MVCVLASSAEVRWFDPRSGQTKDLKIGICCFPLSRQHLGVRTKTGRPRVRVMGLSKVACLPVDFCFCELAR